MPRAPIPPTPSPLRVHQGCPAAGRVIIESCVQRALRARCTQDSIFTPGRRAGGLTPWGKWGEWWVTFGEGMCERQHLLRGEVHDKKICMEAEPILKTLQRIPWFLELSQEQLEALARIACMRSLGQDEVLFHEGDAEDCFYVLLDGQLRVETHVPGHGMYLIYTAEPLDIVGWSVLTPVIRQRTGTASANLPSQLICFNSKLLRQFCEEDTHFGYVIMRRVANVVASRMLVTRLRLYELLHETEEHPHIGYV